MRTLLLGTVGLIVAHSAAAAQTMVADQYRAEARNRAERCGYMVTYNLQCSTAPNQPGDLFGPGAPPPTRLFDNLYYVGLNSVGAYVVQTSAGLILLDALNNPDDVRSTIVPGMKALGLDPAQIKYVIISHGHGDHYGGAKYIAETYKARVVASAADWDYMHEPRPAPFGGGGRPAPNWGAPPARDLVAKDGEKLTLGDTTITIVLTPGHTLGTLSFIVPVFDKGEPHMLAMWGGTAVPNVAEAHRQYLGSFDHFESFTKPMAVDVELSNHPFVDGSLDKMETLRTNPNAPNPFVIGSERYADYTGVLKNRALARAARG
jgi:metallo-beta-lactamase class B